MPWFFNSISECSAGNVIGGGDWADNRIVPDMARALGGNRCIDVRSPRSVRPWQHVLEPLGGYLMLAQTLYSAQQENNSKCLDSLSGGVNFGPEPDSHVSVERLVTETIELWPGQWKDCPRKAFRRSNFTSSRHYKGSKRVGLETNVVT